MIPKFGKLRLLLPQIDMPYSVVIFVTALLILKVETIEAARWLWEIIPNRPARSVLSIEPESRALHKFKGE